MGNAKVPAIQIRRPLKQLKEALGYRLSTDNGPAYRSHLFRPRQALGIK